MHTASIVDIAAYGSARHNNNTHAWHSVWEEYLPTITIDRLRLIFSLTDKVLVVFLRSFQVGFGSLGLAPGSDKK